RLAGSTRAVGLSVVVTRARRDGDRRTGTTRGFIDRRDGGAVAAVCVSLDDPRTAVARTRPAAGREGHGRRVVATRAAVATAVAPRARLDDLVLAFGASVPARR